jgi:hypothetical protein
MRSHYLVYLCVWYNSLSFGPDLCGTQTKHVVATLFDVDGTPYTLSKKVR